MESVNGTLFSDEMEYCFQIKLFFSSIPWLYTLIIGCLLGCKYKGINFKIVVVLADTLNMSPGGKAPMCFQSDSQLGWLCGGVALSFQLVGLWVNSYACGDMSAKCCWEVLGTRDVSERRGQTLCYKILLPVALYLTAWIVALSCLSQTDSLPQFSLCLHDLYVSHCFLLGILRVPLV